jgi:hypothetical protein
MGRCTANSRDAVRTRLLLRAVHWDVQGDPSGYGLVDNRRRLASAAA